MGELNRKTAENRAEAESKFAKFDREGLIQWKGTDVCMDFHCECGHHNHYDGFFAYEVKCYQCGAIYAPSGNVEMIKLSNPDGQYIESIETYEE